MTKQRAAILQVIRNGRHHYTAEEIFFLAKELLPGISRATVYNNLKSLESEELIRRIDGEGAAGRFDSSPLPHGHLFCLRCGEIEDFSVEGFESILSDAVGSEIESYQLSVKGVCSLCKKREAFSLAE